MKDLQPTSPKSMYVLADSEFILNFASVTCKICHWRISPLLKKVLQLPELRDEALEQFKRSLSIENVCIELICSFAGRYDEARDILIQFLRTNVSLSVLLPPSLVLLPVPFHSSLVPWSFCYDLTNQWVSRSLWKFIELCRRATWIDMSLFGFAREGSS